MYDIRNMNIWKKEAPRESGSDYLRTEIAELNLSVRSYNCLKRAGCNTVGDILALLAEDEDGLRKVRNLGSRSETEILEKIQQFRECCRDAGKPQEADPSLRRMVIRPSKQVWSKEIGEFRLSEHALSDLRRHGISQVKDLYTTEPGNEPGWYAVRELFERIAAGAR